MPGLLKIGHSINGGQLRADALQAQGGTSLPFPFAVEFEIATPEFKHVEKLVHIKLGAHRANKSREFFSVPLAEAKKEIIT